MIQVMFNRDHHDQHVRLSSRAAPARPDLRLPQTGKTLSASGIYSLRHVKLEHVKAERLSVTCQPPSSSSTSPTILPSTLIIGTLD